MNGAVSAIYTPQTQPVRLALAGRILAGGLAVGCLAVLILAAWLQPSASGLSTHTQLGLQPCGFAQRLNIPCPTCGMTTSFAFLLHGRPLASVYIQPMGALLGVLTAMVFWGAAYVAATGRPAYRLLRLVPTSYIAFPLAAFAILAWAWKIFIHVRGIDGWGC